ncbi:MAG TPA: 3'-5' exonuclease [Thermoanaerobaculia bacterium]
MVNEEVYVSVDIEAAGPIPGEYSMLSIGASFIGEPGVTFYIELKPINGNAVAEALTLNRLDLVVLARDGEEPTVAMSQLRDWVKGAAAGRRPVFVGFNTGFDWSFVNWYFHKFLGENPFGFAALDIKSYYMGFSGCAWKQTTSSQIPGEFQPDRPNTHNALDDAIAQGQIFAKLLGARQQRRGS